MTRLERAIDALRDALEHERDALRNGRLDLIMRLAQHRERLMLELRAVARQAPDGIDALTLTMLRADVEKNQRMLVAAGKGIKSVVERIAAIRASAGKLTTYGADGNKTEHYQRASQTSRLEHKA
ncbi:MAG: hypothetical protein AAFN59_01525 [Pseudomonadota bacterium]